MALRLQSPPACLPPLPHEPAGRPQSASLPLPLPIHRPKEALPPLCLGKGASDPAASPPGTCGGARGLASALQVGLTAEGPGANQRLYLSSSAEARHPKTNLHSLVWVCWSQNGVGVEGPGSTGPTGRALATRPGFCVRQPVAATETQPGVPLVPPPNACALSTPGQAGPPPRFTCAALCRAPTCVLPAPAPADKGLPRAPLLALCTQDRDSTWHPATI